MSQTFTSDIVHLNVGGTKFSTSRQTLTSVQDSFFTSLLSGRIPTFRDETGALFIDRDPKLFSIILNFLRTKELDLNGVDISVLKHEADFYGVTPLSKRLSLCEDLERSLCGDVLFTGFIQSPSNPPISANTQQQQQQFSIHNNNNNSLNQTNLSTQSSLNAANTLNNINKIIKTNASDNACKPGNVMRLTPTLTSTYSNNLTNTGTNNNNGNGNSTATGSNQRCLAAHSRNSSIDFMNANSKTHSRKSSYEVLSTISSGMQSASVTGGGGGGLQATAKTHSYHSRNQSLDLKQMKTDLGILLSSASSVSAISAQQQQQQQARESTCSVNIIAGHHNWIAVAHPHFVSCYKMKDGIGWQLMFQSQYIEEEIDRIAINSKHQPIQTSSAAQSNMVNSSSNSNFINMNNANMTSNNSSSNLTNNVNLNVSGSAAAASAPIGSIIGGGQGSLAAAAAASGASPPAGQSIENTKLCAVLAIAFESNIRLWLVNDETNTYQIGTFSLGASVDNLFFIGSQLVATKNTGKIGVWNSLSQLWQIQDVTAISSFDTAGSFLLLGGQNGIIYYIDMQKFPLRIKDNDLLVTELYKDASGEAITALSVYLTPKTTNTGNWIEIAYGTSSGNVRVIVQHPETVGHGPQLFQTFSVHRSPVIKVMLTEKYLVSVCAEYNHVRTWTVTRFRGMISTQPGSTPLASFKIVSIDAFDSRPSYSVGNDIGPFGEREDQQVFIQKVVPYTDQLFVRLSSTGKRICTIKSVDYSIITSFCVHECDGPSRLNSRPRRYLFTGHANGTIQMWDLTTALELKPSDQTSLGGPSASELVRLLDQCDLSSNSGYSTPTCLSPCPSLYSVSQSKCYLNKNLYINSSSNNMFNVPSQAFNQLQNSTNQTNLLNNNNNNNNQMMNNGANLSNQNQIDENNYSDEDNKTVVTSNSNN